MTLTVLYFHSYEKIQEKRYNIQDRDREISATNSSQKSKHRNLNQFPKLQFSILFLSISFSHLFFICFLLIVKFQSEFLHNDAK